MKNLVMVALLSAVGITAQAQRPELEARKAPVYDCGDLEYDEETGLVYYKNVPFQGKCKSFYENNSLEREVEFIDGKEHGVSKSYYQKAKDTTGAIPDNRENRLGGNKEKPKEPADIVGQLQSVTSFNMGIEDGTWVYYFENGKLAWSNTYVNGVKNGRWTWYFNNGNPKKVESYANNLLDGVCITYYEGKDSTFKKSEINYKEGKFDGSYKLWYDNGELKVEMNYKMGKEDGEMLSYYSNKQLAIQQNYKNGYPDGEWREWYDNGQERKIENYVNGRKEGEHKEFHKEGQVKSISVYKQNNKIAYEEYDEFGNKLETDFKAPETKVEDSGKKKKKKRKGAEEGTEVK